MASLTSAYYYNDGSSGVYAENDFSIPEYESQDEMLTMLVAPFIVIALLLQLSLRRALRFAYAEDDNPSMLNLVENNRPPVDRYATVMSLAITAMLIPTPFWDYVILAINSLGVIAVGGLVVLFLYMAYLVAKF